MPSLVRDEKGSYFVDTGGGTYQPVTEEQARTFQGNQGAGQGAFQAAGQGLENLITGAGSLLSDNPYWQQANEQGRQQSDVLNLANPVTSSAAQFAPQVLAGVATAGAGLPAVMGLEGALGAMTTPESPFMGAAIGAGTAGLAEVAPGAAAALYGRGRQMAQRLPWFQQADAMSEVPVNPGGMLPGERPPLDMPEAAPGPVAGPAPDFPSNPPDPMQLLRARAAELDAQEATARSRGRTAAQAPGGGGGGGGGFFEGPPGPPIPDSPSANPPGARPSGAPRMAERVTQTIENEAGAGQQVAGLRVMEGTLTPAELYARGVPTSKAQRDLLTATSPDKGAAARTALAAEEASASHPLFGGQVRAVRDAQQQAATNFITRELDIPHGVNLTDPMLSDVVANIGGRMDQIAGEMGTVPLTADIKNEFADILGQTTGSHKGQLQQLIDEIGAKADLNSGVLTGDQWSEMRTKINRMIEAGTRQGNIGKVSDAGALMETMAAAMESGLPDATRAELARLRKQYAIASTLTKPGTRNADGQVNPLSFYNNWKRPQSKKTRGTDEVGRFMNTMVTLTAKRTPDSGTAGRLLHNLGNVATDLLPGGQTARRVLGI